MHRVALPLSPLLRRRAADHPYRDAHENADEGDDTDGRSPFDDTSYPTAVKGIAVAGCAYRTLVRCGAGTAARRATRLPECRGWRGVGVIKEQRALGACLERTARRVLKVTSPTPPGSNERGALS